MAAEFLTRNALLKSQYTLERCAECRSIEMPLHLTHRPTKKLNSIRSASRLSSSQPILPSRGNNTFSDLEDPAGGLRRSQHTHRPSSHKLESDEYQASSRGSSRPASPSALTPNKRPKKNPFGIPSNRPGRLTHPDVNARSTSHGSSPKSSTKPGPQLSNSHLATRSAASNAPETITTADAIRRAMAFLGADASHLSTKTLQMVLAEIPGDEETDNPESMEIEGGSAPAILQPTERLVLESRHQLRPSRTAGVPTTPQHSQTRSAHPNESHTSSQPRVGSEVAHDEDTATESESQPESIKLGPGDLVSQRLLTSSRPITAVSIPNPPPPITTTWAYSHANKDNPSNRILRDSDTATVDESDSPDSDSDSAHKLNTAHASKRQRLLKDPPGIPLPPPRVSHAGTSGPHSIIPSLNEFVTPRSDDTSSHHSAHISLTHSTHPATLNRSCAAPTAPASPPASPSSLPWPLPSDIGGLLAWAAQLADQIARLRVPANQASTSLRASQTSNPNDQLAQVLSDLRTSLATSMTISPANVQRPSKCPRHTDLVEDNAEILELEAALTLGTHVRARCKPNFSDFPGLQRRIASLAVPEFLVSVCTWGAYETLGTFHDWAAEAYNHLWPLEASDLPLQKAPYALRGILVHRVSWLRGDLKARLRPLIPFLMLLINPPKTADDLKRNRRRVKKLLPNRFHCLDINSDADPFSSPAVPECIAAGLFWGPDSLGAMYHNKFRPIPLPTVAMIVTIMQHCIEEWKPRRFVPLDLKADRQLRMYDSHLKGLIECAKPAGKCLAGFQETWFWHGLDHAGVGAKNDELYQSIIRANQIRPDTPF
ncbi:hypothetical protein BDV93DRAFT_512334 [Ceratobasidium sp. AG-I]|nr:hypothetical protein BDV93DRAFT_512334 [Ceratobasidium sp. AG-I]